MKQAGSDFTVGVSCVVSAHTCEALRIATTANELLLLGCQKNKCALLSFQLVVLVSLPLLTSISP